MIDADIKPYPLITAAIKSGDVSQLAELFRRFPEMASFRVPGFHTWLHYAASNGSLPIVEYLASLGFDINFADDLDGVAPLKLAAYSNQYEIAKYLLDRGSRMDTSASVRNPLFGAIVGQSPRIARLLLDRGIDASVRYRSETMDDMDATAFALERGEHEIAGMIAQHLAGGDPEKTQLLLAEADSIMRRNDRLSELPPEEH